MVYEPNTWRKLLASACELTGDDPDSLITTLSEEEKDIKFGDACDPEVPHFTAWSENFVYFPTVYDGSSDVEYVPRNPCDTKTKPIGGG